MRATTLALTAVLGLAMSAISVQAAQILPATGNHSPAIVPVIAGCGFGWHPTPWGECMPNHRMHFRPFVDRPIIEQWDEYDHD